MSKYFPRTGTHALPIAIALTLAAPVVHADDSPPSIEAPAERLQALERRLGVTPDDALASGTRDLDQRLRVIERKLELPAEEAAAKAAKDPVVSLAPTKGLSVKSPDGLELKVRGLVQADARIFIGDDNTPQNDTFVSADGLHRRLSPQGYFYRGPSGVLGEYITSEQEVRVTSGANAGRRDHLVHDAYQLTASVVLTGEDASHRGVAKPNQPFTLDGAGWGAFELVGRYGMLDVDDDTFPLFANAATSASAANAWTLGLNWYSNSNLKLVTNCTETRFEGGAPAGADREDEK